MALANVQVSVYSPIDGSVRIVLDGTAFDELKYSRALNDIGALAMTLPSSADWSSIFTLDAFVEVERTSPTTGRLQVEETYLTRLTHRFREGNEEKFVVGALSLNHLLARRLINPDDDPAAAGGYSTKAGPADDVMVDYANEQAGPSASAARQFPNLTVGVSASVGASVGRRLRFENLFETLQGIANQGSVDFIITRLVDNQLRLTVAPIGSDRSQSRNYPGGQMVLLNPLRGNLSDPSLLFDRKQEQNFVYALGQGPGENRIVVPLGGEGVGDSPYNRIEFTSDIRSAERGDTTTILTSARAALFDRQAAKEFSFKPTGSEPGATYRQDYDLGDIITATWDNDSIDLRVREVEITMDAGGEDISVKVLPI